jgi:hypothetical protein
MEKDVGGREALCSFWAIDLSIQARLGILKNASLVVMLRAYAQQQNASDLRESRLKLRERTQRLSDIVRHAEIQWMLYRLSELSARRDKCAPEVAGRARWEGQEGGCQVTGVWSVCWTI